MCTFSAFVAFNKRTNRYIKHEKDKKLRTKKKLNVTVETESFLPRKDRVWK